MNGILVRVGIDGTTGRWNAPVDPASGSFVYVPVPEDERLIRPEYVRRFDELEPALRSLGAGLPEHLRGRAMHLDPDFAFLTYGDRHPRDLPLRALKPRDFIVFYAGMRPLHTRNRQLVYAIIGFFSVAEVLSVSAVPAGRWRENAHTRRFSDPSETIVRGLPESSGRLQSCIPVGEYRHRAYRVRADLLDEWGGLSVLDGFLQRSGRLPSFRDPERFLAWFRAQAGTLVRKNC